MKKHEQIFQLLFESAAEGLVVVNRSGEIQMVNPQIGHLFGFEEHELLEQRVEILIPSVLEKAHRGHLAGYMKDPKTRSMGSNMNLQAQRKDGSLFHVEVGLNHFSIEEDIYVMALISDITDRAKITGRIRNG